MRRILAFACLTTLAACGAAEEQPGTADAAEAPASAAPALTPVQEAFVSDLRRATAKYADVAVAEAEGFMRDPANHCVTAELMGHPAAMGAMGVHYFRPDLLGITDPAPPISGADGVIDAALPEILVYEPQADGSMQLVAAEYLVFQDAWAAAGNTTPPVLAEQEFFAMADDPATPLDEAHDFAPHHELHVWTGRDNPAGAFAEFNPTVTCAHHAMAGMEH
jgi:hypothetical protein